MNNEIINVLVTFAGTCVGTIGGILINTKLINYRLEMLEKKVEKHNNLIERMYKVEGKVQEIENDIKDLKK